MPKRKTKVVTVEASTFTTWEVTYNEEASMIAVPLPHSLQEVLWAAKTAIKLPPDTHGNMYFADEACTVGEYTSSDGKHKFKLRRLP